VADYARVALPREWVPLDLRSSVASVDEVVKAIPQLAPRKHEIELLLSTAVAATRATGVVLSAVLLEEVEGYPLLATLLVSMRPASEGQPGSIRKIASQLGGEVVRLRAGRAVRTSRVATLQLLPDTRAFDALCVEYVIPGPKKRGELITLTFMTPNVSIGDAFSRLFGAVANSLLIRPDEPSPN